MNRLRVGDMEFHYVTFKRDAMGEKVTDYGWGGDE